MSLLAALLLVAFSLLVRRQGAHSAGRLSAMSNGRLATGLFAGFLLATSWLTTSRVDSFVAGVAFLLLLPGRVRERPRLDTPRFLEFRSITLFVGVASAVVPGLVWGSLDPVARFHDEEAYLLQARIFASGHWSGRPPPLPEFFEQMQVFVTPTLVSKYPPGHSLILTPGVWLRTPALLPLMLNGLSGALIFLLARRLAGGSVALLTWLLWLSAPGTLSYRASYLSENTTAVLWLVALLALQEWLASRRRRWLLVLAACVGFGALTRPMTIVALALPIGCVLIRRSAEWRHWKDLVIAAAIVAAFVALQPLWNLRTMGDWRINPYSYYSRVYFPYEWTGFGEKSNRPLRSMPPAMEGFDRQFRKMHAQHTPRSLPDTLVWRIQGIAADQWGGGRKGLAPFALLGFLALGPAGMFVALSSVMLITAYLFLAHSPSWTVYYLEIQPFLAFVTAFGIGGVLASCHEALSETTANRKRWSRMLTAVIAAVALVLCGEATINVIQAREERRTDAAAIETFQRRIARLPGNRIIVFVRYGPGHDPHRNLVVNSPDGSAARAWIVHDLGVRDRQLADLAPERVTYLYDEERGSFEHLRREPGGRDVR